MHCKDFIRKDITDVRRHVNESHGMGAKGGIERIDAQSWFAGRNTRYWRVDVGKVDVEKMECVWGLFGMGWGDKLPRYWPKVEEKGAVVQSEVGEVLGRIR